MFDSFVIHLTADNTPYHLTPPAGATDDMRSGYSVVIKPSQPITYGGKKRQFYPVAANTDWAFNNLDPDEAPYLNGPPGTDIPCAWQGVVEGP